MRVVLNSVRGDGKCCYGGERRRVEKSRILILVGVAAITKLAKMALRRFRTDSPSRVLDSGTWSWHLSTDVQILLGLMPYSQKSAQLQYRLPQLRASVLCNENSKALCMG